MSDLVLALLLGLGIMKIMEMIKEDWRPRQRIHLYPRWKSILTGLMAAGSAYGLVSPGRWEDVCAVALGAWGFSALAHAIDTGVRAWGDSNKIEAMRKGFQGRSRN